MISRESRYLQGSIVIQPDNSVGVHRAFPPPQRKVILYTWKQTDRLDRIAAQYLGNPTLWWRIMDANPLVQDPHDIGPGEQIRIPVRV